MSFVTLARILAAWAALMLIALLVGRSASTLREPSEPTFIASKWRDGKLVGRTLTKTNGGAPLDEIPGTLVFERIIGESWLPAFTETGTSISLLAAHDGVRVDLDGKTAYVTPDDLLARQAYDHGVSLDDFGLTMGVDMPIVVALAAERLEKNPLDVKARAKFRRIRTTRSIPGRFIPSIHR